MSKRGPMPESVPFEQLIDVEVVGYVERMTLEQYEEQVQRVEALNKYIASVFKQAEAAVAAALDEQWQEVRKTLPDATLVLDTSPLQESIDRRD